MHCNDAKTNYSIKMITSFQSNEVDNSYNMELEGLKRAMTSIEEAGIAITHLVTDRHSQVYYVASLNGKQDYSVFHVVNTRDVDIFVHNYGSATHMIHIFSVMYTVIIICFILL